jgi:hypothetical protein
MSHRRYAILRVGNFWRIVGRRQAEDFPTRDSVALATARLAAQAIQDGYQVELVITPPVSAQRPLESDREFPGPGPRAEEAAAHTRYRQNSGEFAVAVDKTAARADAPRSFQQVWSARV